MYTLYNSSLAENHSYFLTDLYNQTIVVSSDDIFHARFPNIFVDYPLESMRVGDNWWTNWNKAPLRLWQTQLNFAVWSLRGYF